MTILDTIVELSHEFGTEDYVRGGGGNTSAKDEKTLWVKPSGTTLKGMTADAFVAMDRARIDRLYDMAVPDAAAAREAQVKDAMAAAVSGGEGRPSVEAPLHNVFSATYVVHTHPALVNGMTCAVDGESVCERLFPDALWVEYIDPGYTLCMEVRKRIAAHTAANGAEPQMLFLKNHGVFVAASTAEAIRERYHTIMTRLAEAYDRAGVSQTLGVAEAPNNPEVDAAVLAAFGEDAACMAKSGGFARCNGPVSPDHLVYAKAFQYEGELSAAGAAVYRNRNGFSPKVVVTDEAVYGIGTSQRNADLALEFAQDAGLVGQLASAFGGVAFMSDAARSFIENWEVESYRAKQA